MTKRFSQFFLAAVISCGMAGLGNATETVVARLVDSPVKIDGVLDDAIWKLHKGNTEGAATAWRRVGNPEAPASDTRTALFAYDSKKLYIALIVENADAPPDDAPTADDPDSVRLDFEGSALAIESDGKQIEKVMIPYLIPVERVMVETENGWIAEIAVEWSQLAMLPERDAEFPFNIAGTDMSGPISWAKVEDFRDIKNFGRMKLQ